MAVTEYIRCGNCQGTGVVRTPDGKAGTCPRCMGRGEVKNPAYKPPRP